jgi:hypothetical protein
MPSFGGSQIEDQHDNEHEDDSPESLSKFRP